MTVHYGHITRKLNQINKTSSAKRKKVLSETLKPPKSREEILLGSPETPRTHHDKHSKVAARILHETRKVVDENRTMKKAFSEVVEQNEILTHSNFALRIAADDNSKILEQTSAVNKENENLTHTNEKLNQEVAILSEKCEKLKAKSTKPHDKVRNLTKIVDRRDDTIENLKLDKVLLGMEMSELESKCEKLETEHSELKAKFESMTKQVDDLHTKLSAEKNSKFCLQQKVSELNIQRKEGKINSEKFREEIKSLREELAHLEEINQKRENGETVTFKDGKYTEEVREVCMKLMNDHNVSMNKLPSVINTVLKPLTGFTATRLPNKGTLCNMNAEAKLITQQQVATEITAEAKPTSSTGNVLHQDASSKYHKHYEGVQTTLSSGKRYSMGIRRVAAGDAETYEKVNSQN